MSERTTLQWIEPAGVPAIGDFMRAHFGSDSIQADPRRLDWLYREHPSGLNAVGVFHNGDLVGFRGYMGCRIYLGGKSINGAFAIDTMIAPEFRRQGLGKRILDLIPERFDIGLSAGQSEAMANLCRKMGVDPLVRLNRALYVRRPALTGGLRNLARDMYLWCTRKPYAGRAVRKRLTPEQAASRATEFGSDRFRADEAGLLMDADSFRWRYFGPAYRDYAAFSVADEEGDLGMAVTRPQNNEEWIIDTYCLPHKRTDFLRALRGTSTAARIVAHAGGLPVTECYREAGFLVRDRNANLVAAVRPSQDLQAGRWLYQHGEGDLDMMRPLTP